MNRSTGDARPTDVRKQAFRLPLWALSLVGFVAMWQFVVSVFHVAPFLIPAPSTLILIIAKEGGLIGRHLLATLSEAIAGLALAVPLGLSIAALMNGSQVVRELVYPHVVLAQAIPLIALAPILLIWFGMGMGAKMLIVAFVCLFPIAVNAYEGFRTIDKGYLELLTTLGASRCQRYRHLYLPAALPSVFAGLKIAATYCMLAAVVGEWLGGIRGIGIYMTRALQSFRNDKLFAAILVVMVTSVLLFKGVDWLGRELTPWIERRVHG